VSRPKLDFTESYDGSIHHFPVQFSEYDITTSEPVSKKQIHCSKT